MGALGPPAHQEVVVTKRAGEACEPWAWLAAPQLCSEPILSANLGFSMFLTLLSIHTIAVSLLQRPIAEPCLCGVQEEPGTSTGCGFSEGVLRFGEVSQGILQDQELNMDIPLPLSL